jgi:hypothetical protein
MTDRTNIRAAAVAALIAAGTAAGTAVYSPRDWPTTPEIYPSIIVRTPRERKDNVAPRSGPPQFFSTITLAVVGRVEATTEAAAEAALEAFSLQIENALLTNGQFIYVNGIQQFVSVETSMDVRAESERHYGETVVLFGIEVFQMFDPTIDAAGAVIGPSLTAVDVVIDLNTGETQDTGINITLPGA